MTIQFDSTAEFQDDLQRLDIEQRVSVVAHINKVAQAFIHDKRAFAALTHKLAPIALQGDLESSLCATRVNEFCIVMATDDDPLFERVLISLLRVVAKSQEKVAYLQAARGLYGSLLQSESGAQETNGDGRKKTRSSKRVLTSAKVATVG